MPAICLGTDGWPPAPGGAMVARLREVRALSLPPDHAVVVLSLRARALLAVEDVQLQAQVHRGCAVRGRRRRERTRTPKGVGFGFFCDRRRSELLRYWAWELA